jgi:poly(3-hydroxybutyrate) depolymerase
MMSMSKIAWWTSLGLCLATGCGPALPVRNGGESKQTVQSAKGRRLGTAELLACLGAPPTAIYQPETLAPGTGPGVQLFTFDQETADCGRVTRRFVVHIPQSLARTTAAPVLIGLPGRGASAEALRMFQARGTFDQLADRDGFIVAYGNGLPSQFSMPGLPNSGQFRSEYAPDVPQAVDELEYLQRIIDDLGSRGVIRGNNPVYLVGHSNGGGLALSATRRRPERYAGVAAFMPFAGFTPAAPENLKNTQLARVMIVLSLTDPALPKGYAESVLSPLVRGYGRALGIDDSALASPTQTPLPDSTWISRRSSPMRVS